MTVTIKFNAVSSLKKSLNKKRKDLSKLDNDIKLIAKNTVKNIKANTKKGVDVHGRRFTAYTQSYKKQKGSSKVDLWLSGDMQKSLRVKKLRKNSYEVSFRGSLSNVKATAHNNGTKKLPKREFFGVSKRSRKDNRKIIGKRAKVLIRKR